MTMQAIIPDTLEGAVVLSLIDFVASFVIISGIGAVLALFPLLNRIGQRSPAAPALEPSRPAVATVDELPIVVIAAAVHVALGPAHRIVRIESSHVGEGWAAEGRLAHHSSHARPSHQPSR
jgi:hypothetical protein